MYVVASLGVKVASICRDFASRLQATIRMLRWALVVLSKDSVGVIPNEICAVVMEKATIVGELRLIRRGFQPSTLRTKVVNVL